MNARNLIALLILALAYVITQGPSISTEVDFTTSPQGVTFHSEAYTVPSPQPLCDTDMDCVTKFPTLIPDANTIDAYLTVYGDSPQFPTKGDCSSVDWLAQTDTGEWFVPTDLDHDGYINCNSDSELGA